MPDRAIPSACVALERRSEGRCRVEEDVVVLFERTRDRLLRYSMSLGLSAHDGEEVIQEVFLALFRHLQRGRPQTNLNAWLFQVTHNLALKRREGDRRKQQTLAELSAAAPNPQARDNPEDQLLDRQRRVRLSSVWRALPEQDRQCLALRAEGLTYREIAAVLGVSLGGVSGSLARSIARFARAARR